MSRSNAFSATVNSANHPYARPMEVKRTKKVLSLITHPLSLNYFINNSTKCLRLIKSARKLMKQCIDSLLTWPTKIVFNSKDYACLRVMVIFFLICTLSETLQSKGQSSKLLCCCASGSQSNKECYSARPVNTESKTQEESPFSSQSMESIPLTDTNNSTESLSVSIKGQSFIASILAGLGIKSLSTLNLSTLSSNSDKKPSHP